MQHFSLPQRQLEVPLYVVSVLLVVLGFFAGLLGAITGIGGGILLSPILALYFAIPIREAIGTSLVAVITTSAASSSVHLQRHTTDIRLGMTLELATSFGAAVTAYLVGYFNRNALEGLFAGFLLYSAITILAKRGKVKPLEEESSFIVDETVIPPYEPKRYPSVTHWVWPHHWWPELSPVCSALAVGRSRSP